MKIETPRDLDPGIAAMIGEVEASAGDTHGTAPSVVTLAGVAPERVVWLWPGRIPAGKITVIDGDPSTGKSTLTLDLAARVSTGNQWPDGARCARGDVLLLSAEDGLADTIAPRLAAAGADPHHVHALTEVPVRDDDGAIRMAPPSLPRDIPVIRSVVDAYKIKLIVIDVLMAYLNGKVDSHRDQDVRGVLHQLSAMAEETGCSIILIRHLNKSGGPSALYRGGGSIGIVGAARAAFLVARDPEDEERRIFAVTKSNLALEPPALAYRLVGDPNHDCARVEWEDGTVDVTANSLLRTPDSDDDRTESGEAAEWLTDLIENAGGSMPRKDILKLARAEGYSEKVLRTGRTKAGIVAERSGFPSTTTWSVPSVRPTKPQSGPQKKVGTTGTTGARLKNDAEDPASDDYHPRDTVGTEPTPQTPAIECVPVSLPNTGERDTHTQHPLTASGTQSGHGGDTVARTPANGSGTHLGPTGTHLGLEPPEPPENLPTRDLPTAPRTCHDCGAPVGVNRVRCLECLRVLNGGVQ